MCCLALSAGFIGPRFALLIWWIFGKGRRGVLDLVLAVPRSALPPLDDTRVRHRLGPGLRRLRVGAGSSSRSASPPTSPRTRRSRRRRATPDRRREAGQDDRVEPAVALLPVAAEHALAPEARGLGEPERRDVLDADEHLHAPEPERANAQSVNARSVPVAIPRPRAAGTTQQPTSPTRCSPGASIVSPR